MEVGQPAVHFETSSGEETVALGRRLVQELLVPPKFLILRGDLGAGKTTLVKGMVDALGAADPDEVTSPTFTLVHEYAGTREGKPVQLYHLDLYRVDQERQLETLGVWDLLQPESLVLVEWGEKFPSIVKRSDGEIVLRSLGGDRRSVTLTWKGGAGKREPAA